MFDKINVGGKMRKKTFLNLGRAILFGVILFSLLAMTPGSSPVAKAQGGPQMPPDDARTLPLNVKSRQSTTERYFALATVPSYAPGYYDTSVYMLGDVAVGIVLPESSGGTENWTTTETNNVINEIQTSLNWWKTTGGTAANLEFVYDLQLGVSTTYEPISRPSSDEALWIGQAMSNLGYTTGDYWDKVYAYNNDIRNQYQTDWAFTIFVVDSSADVDGMFTDGYFAYAYIGGPFMVMTYDNDGWGIEDMDKVTAHEMGHIFMAGDQYGSCSTTKRYGYLGIANGNCNGIPSIMKDNSWAVDSFAKGQIGWQDSDSDNIADILDTVPVVSLSTYLPNPTSNQSLSYNGTVRSPVYPHAVCGGDDWCYSKDVTTQFINSVSYQADGGAWNPAIAQDGAFNSDVEDFSFTTNSLSPGTHSIKVNSENLSGNVSANWNDSVIVSTSAPSFSAGLYDNKHSGWTYSPNWKLYTTGSAYAGSIHYSNTLDDWATFTFEGQKFTLTYTGDTNRGQVDVYIDGTYLTTFDEYNATTAWQKKWSSPTLSPGVHTVQFVHKTGTYVDIDAIEIFASP